MGAIGTVTAATALALLAGCGPERRPASPPPTGSSSTPASESPNPWTDCYEGYRYSGNPRTDLARITKSCGPTAGMRAVTEVTLGAQTEKDPVDRYTFYVPESGACYRVYAAGDRNIRDLDVALRGPDGADVVADVSHDAWPVVPPTAPICFETPGLYMLEVSVFRGGGRYAIQVWAGSPRKH